jgi:hypothetical protein
MKKLGSRGAKAPLFVALAGGLKRLRKNSSIESQRKETIPSAAKAGFSFGAGVGTTKVVPLQNGGPAEFFRSP